MRRLVALLVAVGLVVLAVVIRNGIDNGGTTGVGGKLRLACAAELESVCRQLESDLEIDVQEPGSTADKLEKASGNPGIDGWLTPGPWPEIVEAARHAQGAAPVLALGSPLGRTRVALAVWPDRLAVLLGACPNRQIAWRCLGDAVAKGNWKDLGGDPGWGSVTIAFPDPPNNATGLAALGAATAGYFGKTDLSSADLDDPGFRSWLRKLVAANADNPGLDDVVTRGPAEAAAAATLEAIGQPVIASSARSPKPTLTYPAPVASADVVLGSVISDRGRRLAQLVDAQLPELLRKAGWTSASPPSSGLPPADLLDALRTAWRDAS